MSEPSEEGDRRRGPPGSDRRSPHTSIAPDGTLIFGDGRGRHWQVYDRRSGDRRRSRVLGQSSGFDRIFVSEAGEEWSYELLAEEIIDETAFALERQLAHAVRRRSGPSQ